MRLTQQRMDVREKTIASAPAAHDLEQCCIATTCSNACVICPFGPRGKEWCERPDVGSYPECGGQMDRRAKWDDRVMIKGRLDGLEKARHKGAAA
jgi:hypothetical protein